MGGPRPTANVPQQRAGGEQPSPGAARKGTMLLVPQPPEGDAAQGFPSRHPWGGGRGVCGTLTTSTSPMGAAGGETGALGRWGWLLPAPQTSPGLGGLWGASAGVSASTEGLEARHVPIPGIKDLRRPGIKDFCSFVAGESDFCSLGSSGNPRSCPSATTAGTQGTGRKERGDRG